MEDGEVNAEGEINEKKEENEEENTLDVQELEPDSGSKFPIMERDDEEVNTEENAVDVQESALDSGSNFPIMEGLKVTAEHDEDVTVLDVQESALDSGSKFPIMENEQVTAEHDEDMNAMDVQELAPDSDLQNENRCAGCFKYFRSKLELVSHMRTAKHAIHDIRCSVCRMPFKTFEDLRKHFDAPWETECRIIFSQRGCDFCLDIIHETCLEDHLAYCRMEKPEVTTTQVGKFESLLPPRGYARAIGTQNMLDDMCTRIVLIDEEERIILDAFVVSESGLLMDEAFGLDEDVLSLVCPREEVNKKIEAALLTNCGKQRPLSGYKMKPIVNARS